MEYKLCAPDMSTIFSPCILLYLLVFGAYCDYAKMMEISETMFNSVPNLCLERKTSAK